MIDRLMSLATQRDPPATLYFFPYQGSTWGLTREKLPRCVAS